MIRNLILRLTIWFLLTCDLSLANIIIGVSVSCLLPLSHTSKESLKDWLSVLAKIIMAIPLAYIEAIEMIFRPHNQEEIVMQQVKSNRSSRLIFLDIFLITFTPKTIVLNYHPNRGYEVHLVKRGRNR